jgi:hypothetical protein
MSYRLHKLGFVMAFVLVRLGTLAAQNTTSAYTSVDQILKQVPAGTKLGSKNAINPIAAEAASQQTKKVLYQRASIRVRVEKVEKVHSPLYQTDYRIKGDTYKSTVNGTSVSIVSHFYFAGIDELARLGKVSPKDTLVIEGLIRRADFLPNGSPTFMFDMINCVIK